MIEILKNIEAMPLILIGLLLAAGISLYRYNKNSNSKIDLEDLLIQNDRIDRIATILMGGFMVISWIIIYLTLNGKVTEGYYTAYIGATILPIIMKILKGKEEAKDGTEKRKDRNASK